MTISVVEYYLDELYEWRTAIDLYLEEIESNEKWLRSILHFDSIPALAAKVEHYLNQLLLSKIKLQKIKSLIQSAEQIFHKGNAPSGKDVITEELRTNHRHLRAEMHQAEKEYLEIKYDCDEFLAGAVEIQDKIKNSR